MQHHSDASLLENWRTINIDALDPESSSNFDTSTLHPAFAPVDENEIRTLGQQVRQLLRGGDAEGALRGALEGAPYGGDAGVKELHLQTVTEVLQGIKASEMSPMLQRIFKTEGGGEALDVLMKYLFVPIILILITGGRLIRRIDIKAWHPHPLDLRLLLRNQPFLLKLLVASRKWVDDPVLRMRIVVLK